MRNYSLFIVCALLLSCGEQQQGNNTEAPAEIAESQPTITDSTVAESITPKPKQSWLTPDYLTADFNGDGYSDTATAVVINNKKGILVKHGNTGEEFLIGAGINFGQGGDNFDWVNNWKLVTDKTTYEVTFDEDGEVEGSREVRLRNPAFYIGSREEGGATIAWRAWKYTWIHQAD